MEYMEKDSLHIKPVLFVNSYNNIFKKKLKQKRLGLATMQSNLFQQILFTAIRMLGLLRFCIKRVLLYVQVFALILINHIFNKLLKKTFLFRISYYMTLFL